MKRLFLLLCLLFPFTFTLTAQVYTFPVQPGSAAWNSFTTHQQMVEACQIPSDILATMPTQDLVETCLHYPLLIDCFAYDNDTLGIRAVSHQFNGFAALLKREDAATSLSSILRTTAQRSRTYSVHKSQRVAKAFMALISQTAGRAARLSATQATVYTPNGTQVPDTEIIPEQLTSQYKQECAAEILRTYPGVTILKEATSTYNCHAYAWYLFWNSSATPVWMGVNGNPTHVYWEDGSYVKVNDPSVAGTIAAYTSSNHSAIVTSDPNTFNSKWGQLPLIQHKKEVCPYNSSTFSYYSRPYLKGYIDVASWGRREFMGASTFSTTAPRYASVDMYITDPTGRTTWRLVSDRSTVSSFSSSGNTARLVGSSSTSPAIVEASVATEYTTVKLTITIFFTGGATYSTVINPGASLAIERKVEPVAKTRLTTLEQPAAYAYEIYNQGTASLMKRASNLQQNQTMVDIADFPQGIYVLIIKENNRKVYQTQFRVSR